MLYFFTLSFCLSFNQYFYYYFRFILDKKIFEILVEDGGVIGIPIYKFY